MNVSRYCSAIVFWSICEAAEKMRSSARENPSARRMAACRSPSARRISACLVALGDVDRGLSAALGLGDDRAPRPFGGELPIHRVLDVARRGDLADLDGRDLAAPALGHLVELDPQDLVDLLALGQHVVEEDVADHRAEGRRRDVLEGAFEVLDLDHAPVGVDDPPVDQEVDADRRVVLGDARLARDLDELLAQVDPDAALGDRHDEHPARAFDLVRTGPAEGEDEEPLVLVDDLDRREEQEQQRPGR